MASQFILNGPELVGTVTDISLGRHLYQCLVNYGTRVAMVDALTGETITFSDILTKSLSIAECLHVRGVTAGDVIGICSENSLDSILPVLASYYIGAVCAPLNPSYTTRELLHSVNISKPRIIFCSERVQECMDEVARQAGFVKEIVTFGLPLSHKQTPFISFLRDKSCSFEPLDVNCKNLTAAILCSSGTTGLPKGVMLTQENILCILQYSLNSTFHSLSEEVILLVLPMFHAFGFVLQLVTISDGAKVIIMPKFEEKLFLRSIQNHKVVDLETGKNVGPNERGELCFKGPQIMKGYCGDSQATTASFDSDGFLHTGDVGYYDEDGFFYIVDRVKELIKYKGYQVPPAELEAVLLTHPAVKDAGVIGVPDEAAGELPLAFVVKQPKASVTKEELITYVAGQVSPQKRLHGGLIFVESIPRTHSGKILRRDLKILLKSML